MALGHQPRVEVSAVIRRVLYALACLWVWVLVLVVDTPRNVRREVCS